MQKMPKYCTAPNCKQEISFSNITQTMNGNVIYNNILAKNETPRQEKYVLLLG